MPTGGGVSRVFYYIALNRIMKAAGRGLRAVGNWKLRNCNQATILKYEIEISAERSLRVL
jgi:hypothetical protein